MSLYMLVWRRCCQNYMEQNDSLALALAKLWSESSDSGASSPLAVLRGCQIITRFQRMDRDMEIHLCECSGAGDRPCPAWDVCVPATWLMQDCQLDT